MESPMTSSFRAGRAGGSRRVGDWPSRVKEWNWVGPWLASVRRMRWTVWSASGRFWARGRGGGPGGGGGGGRGGGGGGGGGGFGGGGVGVLPLGGWMTTGVEAVGAGALPFGSRLNVGSTRIA